jgi:hypothetical protein
MNDDVKESLGKYFKEKLNVKKKIITNAVFIDK